MGIILRWKNFGYICSKFVFQEITHRNIWVCYVVFFEGLGVQKMPTADAWLAIGLKKLFVSCNPTLKSFYSKRILTLNFFFRPPKSNQRKTCIKHIFDPKSHAKK